MIGWSQQWLQRAATFATEVELRLSALDPLPNLRLWIAYRDLGQHPEFGPHSTYDRFRTGVFADQHAESLRRLVGLCPSGLVRGRPCFLSATAGRTPAARNQQPS